MGDRVQAGDLGLYEEEGVAGPEHEALGAALRHGVVVRHQAHCSKQAYFGPSIYINTALAQFRSSLILLSSVFRIRISFNADPDPEFFLNADPDPDPGFFDTLAETIFFKLSSNIFLIFSFFLNFYWYQT